MHCPCCRPGWYPGCPGVVGGGGGGSDKLTGQEPHASHRVADAVSSRVAQVVASSAQDSSRPEYPLSACAWPWPARFLFWTYAQVMGVLILAHDNMLPVANTRCSHGR